jgi:hypothetical protein
MYVYAVITKRNKRRTGACKPQCSSKISVERERDDRSEIPRKAKRTARKAVEALGLVKSRGVGYETSAHVIKPVNVSSMQGEAYQLH